MIYDLVRLAKVNPYFTWLDFKVDDIVLPLKQRLEAKGENLFIT